MNHDLLPWNLLSASVLVGTETEGWNLAEPHGEDSSERSFAVEVSTPAEASASFTRATTSPRLRPTTEQASPRPSTSARQESCFSGRQRTKRCMGGAV